MGLFHIDSVALYYSNVEAAKRWWMDAFGCKVVKVPPDWDNPLPSDVAPLERRRIPSFRQNGPIIGPGTVPCRNWRSE